ncbi:DUF3658 domain-containing protein [Nocardia sp. NPDC003482]
MCGQWWAEAYTGDFAEALRAEVTDAEQRLRQRLSGARAVVWTGRRRAQEVALHRMLAGRADSGSLHAIDVSAAQADSVAEMSPERLAALLGSERPVTDDERAELARSWSDLEAENAPFRVMSEQGLRSAPVTHFDERLLAAIPAEATPMTAVIAEVMGTHAYPVMDYVLQQRLIDLIDTGRVTAQGDPRVARSCRIMTTPTTPAADPRPTA